MPQVLPGSWIQAEWVAGAVWHCRSLLKGLIFCRGSWLCLFIPDCFGWVTVRNKILKEINTQNGIRVRIKGLGVQLTHCIAWPRGERTAGAPTGGSRTNKVLFFLLFRKDQSFISNFGNKFCFSFRGAVRSHVLCRVDGIRGKLHTGRIELVEHHGENKGLFSPFQKISRG